MHAPAARGATPAAAGGHQIDPLPGPNRATSATPPSPRSRQPPSSPPLRKPPSRSAPSPRHAPVCTPARDTGGGGARAGYQFHPAALARLQRADHPPSAPRHRERAVAEAEAATRRRPPRRRRPPARPSPSSRRAHRAAAAARSHAPVSPRTPPRPRADRASSRLRPMNTSRLLRASPVRQGCAISASIIMCTPWKTKRRSAPARSTIPFARSRSCPCSTTSRCSQAMNRLRSSGWSAATLTHATWLCVAVMRCSCSCPPRLRRSRRSR